MTLLVMPVRTARSRRKIKNWFNYQPAFPEQMPESLGETVKKSPLLDFKREKIDVNVLKPE